MKRKVIDFDISLGVAALVLSALGLLFIYITMYLCLLEEKIKIFCYNCLHLFLDTRAI